MRRAAIRTYWGHDPFVPSYTDYDGAFCRVFTRAEVAGEPWDRDRDHMVGNGRARGDVDLVRLYSNVMGFSRYITFDDKDINTETRR